MNNNHLVTTLPRRQTSTLPVEEGPTPKALLFRFLLRGSTPLTALSRRLLLPLSRPLSIPCVLVASTFCSFLMAVPAHAQTPASILESIPVPHNAEVLTISDYSLIEGLPAAMATLTSSGSVESVISFYSHAWQPNEAQDDPGSVQSVIPGWRMISRMEEGYNIVVQLRDGQSPASGFISVLELNQQPQRVRSENNRLFSNLQNLSHYQSVDGKDISTVSVYASPVSVPETHSLYREKLRSKGWQIMADTPAQGSFVMVVSRDQSRMELSVVESSDYGSIVVVNEVRSE